MKPLSLAWWFEDVPIKQAANETGMGPVYTAGEVAVIGTAFVGTLGGMAIAGAAVIAAANVVLPIAIPAAVMYQAAQDRKFRRFNSRL